MSSSVIPATTPVSWTKVPDGTAALPSFAFTNSQGTGFYRVSADVLGLSTAGVQRVVVDASGNVGIGVTPSAWSNQFKAIQIGSRSALYQDSSAATAVGNNIYNDGTNRYLTTGAATVALQDSGAHIWYGAASGTAGNAITFAERMRIDNVGTVTISGGNLRLYRTGIAQGSALAQFDDGTTVSFLSYAVTAGGWNAAATASLFGRNSVTLRSINAGGTVNASGADYAEYMTKAGDFTIAKGDICGINAEGKLTKTFSEAVAFMVKSTNPSYVGSDSWGAGLEAGSEELEAARQLVDRIAFCGQVPVNVLGATPGQWIIPIEDNDEIKGEAVSNPSFEQYQKAVGKVIAIEQDGRARIIVKVA